MITGLDILAGGLLHLAAAGEIACAPKRPTDIRIVPTKVAVTYDRSKSRDELGGFHIDTQSPYGNNVTTHVGGLMSGEVAVKHKIGFMQETFPAYNRACMYVDSLEVSLHITPTIYIAREYVGDPCMYPAIMTHERKHVREDQLIINKYADRIGKALYAHFEKNDNAFGTVPAHELPALQKRIQDYFNGIVTQVSEQMSAERLVRQQKIDSFEEYESIRLKCPNSR